MSLFKDFLDLLALALVSLASFGLLLFMMIVTTLILIGV